MKSYLQKLLNWFKTLFQRLIRVSPQNQHPECLSNQVSDIKPDKAVSKIPRTDQGTHSSISSSSPPQRVTTNAHFFSEPSSRQIDEVETGYIGQQIELLEWAIQSSQKVRFSYEKRNGEKSDRTVTPTGFKTIEHTLCLESYCHLRKAKRTFVVKRMREVKIVSFNQTSYKPQSYSQSTVIQVLPTDIPAQKNIDPQSYSQSTVIQVLPTDIPAQKNIDPQSYSQRTNKTLRTNAATQNRPYIRCSFDELERITNSEWSNLKVLIEIHQELGSRSRKKAHALRERISQRLTQLQGTQFKWPTTTAQNGSQNLSSKVFKYEEGLLRQCGYKVGANGLLENKRRQILDSVFLCSLAFIDNPIYLEEWGEPNTDRRLKKLAESLAAFTRNAKRRNIKSLSEAIQDWETDLAYLKRTYYNGRFYFQWPCTTIS